MNTIKGYVIEEEVGSGGFGVVYRARRPSAFDLEVAIKVIRPRLANEPDFIRRFEGEAQIVARLQHPFIVPLHDFWRDQTGAYLVMRWLGGGSVFDALQSGALDLRLTNNILQQVALALTAAHQHGVIHRDVKPSNIILDEHGNAYLTDFGIAKDLTLTRDNDTHADSVIGSPGYLAPEQARREILSPRTDVYSLGVTLFEMLAGEHPFKDANTIDKLFKHLNEPLPSLPNLSDDLGNNINQIIQKATAKNPLERFADPLELANAFAAIVDQERTTPPNIVSLLTRREQEVLQLLVEGKTNKEIAAALVITVNTVRVHLRQAYKKLNVRTRMQAIVKVRELNLIVDDAAQPDQDASSATYLILPDAPNPYKGLNAFTAADTKDFFGRETLLQRLLKLMQADHDYQRFLAVVGPSGSGKSSLIKAGLIPAIWRGEITGSDNWYTIDLIPGAHPLDELEIALKRVAGEQANSIREQLERDERGLVRVAQLILPEDDTEMLIVIDQFEEIFTLVADAKQRKQFLNLIVAAITDPRSRLRIVVTLRADFYDRPLQYPAFGEIMRSRMETVLPLSAEELEAAIVKPAAAVGVKFANGLVASIIGDINYQPGALPLLQYALTELFDRRDGRVITREAYQTIGGTVGALARRADTLFNEFDDASQQLARQLFLRMVTLGEGTEDTRRRVELNELLSITDQPDIAQEIIDAYAEYRLLSLDHDPASRKPTVEVAHEAMLREWELLRKWLNDSRDDIKQQRQVAAQASAWSANGRDEAYLVRGVVLDQLSGWAEHTDLQLSPVERDFLTASLDARTQRKRQAAAQAARETHLRTQRQRILQGLVAVFMIASLISGGLAIFAFDQQSQAQEERDNAQQARDEAEASEQEALRQASIGLAAQASTEIDSELPDRAVLLALEALEYYPYTSQAKVALARAVDAYVPFADMWATSPLRIRDVSWSMDGKYIVAAGLESGFSMWNAETGGEVARFGEDETLMVRYRQVTFSDDAQFIATASEVGETAEIWSTGNSTRLQTYDEHSGAINTVSIAHRGDLAVSGSIDHTAHVWNVFSGQRVHTLAIHAGSVEDTGWSPNDRLIATVSLDGLAILWDAESGDSLMTINAHVGGATTLAWSPDGTQLATGGVDAAVRVWDVSTGALVATYAGHDDTVRDVEWSPDGKALATASADGSARLWNALSATQIRTLQRRSNDMWSVAWSPDGRRLAMGSGNSLRIWELPPMALQLVGHTEGLIDAAWSPDAALIATSSRDGTINVWSADEGVLLTTFDKHGTQAYFFAWSPNSTQIVSVGEDSVVRIWNARTGAELMTMDHNEDFVWQADWSPDGQYIASGGNTVRVWNAQTGEAVTRFSNDCLFITPSWSPDSTRIVTDCQIEGSSGDVIWDALSGAQIARLPVGATTIRSEWSPDGDWIVTRFNNELIIWDAATGQIRNRFPTTVQHIWDVEWSLDGTRLVTGDESGFVRVWDALTGDIVQSVQVPNGILNVEYAPNGRRVVASGSALRPDFVSTWSSTDELIRHAYDCCVTRELTPEEREQFGLPPRN